MHCSVQGCNAAYVRKDSLRTHINSAHKHLGEEFVKMLYEAVKNIRIPTIPELKENYAVGF